MDEQRATVRLTPSPGFLTRLGGALAITFAVVAYWSYGRLVFTGHGTDLGTGVLLGGDWVAFHEAAKSVGTPRMDTLYQFDAFTASLRERYPGHGSMKFGWQYPPTMLELLRPWRALSFRSGFFLWTLAGLLAFGAVVWRRLTHPVARLLVVTSPVVLLAIITGQTGLFTGALVGIALYAPERRPWAAGLAAGLLTVKPQLGVLIPVAYLAARCWRAIAVAAGTALVLATVTVLDLGAPTWLAFVNAVRGIAGKMQAAEFPAERFTTPFGLLQALGVPTTLAMAGQTVLTLTLAAWVAWAWWPARTVGGAGAERPAARLRDADWRLAAIAVAIPFATPYAMYYELPMVLLAVTLVAVRAAAEGWWSGERAALIALWALPFLPNVLSGGKGVPLYSVLMLLALWVVVRRVRRSVRAL